MSETISIIRDFDYPWDSFARVSHLTGVLEHPDIAELHQLCLSSEFSDKIAYDQGILALLHACDMAYQDRLDEVALQGIALCLADVHFRTGHYQECWEELLFANEFPHMERYLGQALKDVSAFLPDGTQSPSSVTTRILVDY